MTIEEMKQKKKDFGYSYEMIAQRSGLPIGTVQKVLGGITKHPRYSTLKALEKVFITYDFSFYDKDDIKNILKEDEPAYGRTNMKKNEKKQGEYTIADIDKLPDDKMVELIDGVIYDMFAPKTYHQLIAGLIFNKLLQFISNNNGMCVPFIAPTGVQLDDDEKTQVLPDVMIVCDRDKIDSKVVHGAPDFIVEVLSDSTKSKDMHIKLTKYANAGVKEYWMIDPEKKKIIVNDFEHEDVNIYGFKDEVPVIIYGGKCVIDFNEISSYISFLI